MGTNYYHRTAICSCCNRYNERHIGKSSSGWTFSFQAIEEDDLKIESWKGWQAELSKGGLIFDEYGEEVSLAELTKLVESKKDAKLNHTTYCAKVHPGCAGLFLDQEGHSFSYGDFS